MFDHHMRLAVRAWFPEVQKEIDARDIVAALDRALVTKSWSETAEPLEREQTALLSDAALLLLGERCDVANTAGDAVQTAFLSLRLAVLRRARHVGVVKAWTEYNQYSQAYDAMLDAGLASSPLEQTFFAWLHTPSHAAERRFLEDHPELVGDEALTLAQGWAFWYAGQDQEGDLLAAFHLLRDIRSRLTPYTAHRDAPGTPEKHGIVGGNGDETSLTGDASVDRTFSAPDSTAIVQAIREGCVNAHGGFALDVPVWLEEAIDRWGDLYYAGNPDETAAARESLLRDALRRAEGALTATTTTSAQRDPTGASASGDSENESAFHDAMSLEVVAELRNALGRALAELRAAGADTFDEVIALHEEALAVYTLERYPLQYAMTQGNLGNAFTDRVNGSRRDNIEHALHHYREALRVFTLDRSPVRYADAQNNIGAAYARRIDGSRRDNVEFEIEAYAEALLVYSREQYPADYGMTLNNLGNAYTDRMVGERAEQLEHALWCYEQALAARPRELVPLDHAATQSNLGVAYRQRLLGDRADNLERSIRAHRAALAIYTKDDFPLRHAQAMNNLGVALHERLSGDRAENIEEAIACLSAAAQIRTREAFPLDYAATQRNLAAALADRQTGARDENLTHALQAFEEALAIYSLEDLPLEHRDTQVDLATFALAHLLPDAQRRGDMAGERAAYLRAHQAFLGARHAQAELGWLESDPQGRARSRGWTGPVREMYARDAWCLLSLGDLASAVVALEAGRAQALAEAQQLAGVELDLLSSEEAEDFREAQAAWNEARATGDRALRRAARERLLAARARIRARLPAFLPGEPTYVEVAQAAPASALLYLAAGDLGGMALLLPPLAPRDEAQGTSDREVLPPGADRAPLVLPLPALTRQQVDGWFVRRDGAGLIQGGWRSALDRAGAQLLTTWMRATATADTLHAGESLSDQASGSVAKAPLHAVASRLPAAMRPLGRALERLLDAWQALADDLAMGDLEDQAKAHEVRAYAALPLEAALEQGLLGADFNWLYLEEELSALLPHLSETITQPLRRWLDAQGWADPDLSIALVACGRLGALPLHAAPARVASSAGATGGRDETPLQETCRLTFQASARTLGVAQRQVQALPTTGAYFAVGNPQPTTAISLEWAEAEADTIVELARREGRSGSRALLTTDATKPAVLGLLHDIGGAFPGAWVDVASHGRADSLDPTRCSMLLGGFDADGRGERLTLAELERAQLLQGVRCFSASGCVTAVGDLDTAPDELSSFAAGVLQAGAAAAIATLWSVDDRATFLLMLRCTQMALGSPDTPPALALREAASWLRQATWQDIAGLVRGGTRRLRPIQPAKRADRAAIRGLVGLDGYGNDTRYSGDDGLKILAGYALREARDPNSSHRARPFEHPAYWASAITYGA